MNVVLGDKRISVEGDLGVLADVMTEAGLPATQAAFALFIFCGLLPEDTYSNILGKGHIVCAPEAFLLASHSGRF